MDLRDHFWAVASASNINDFKMAVAALETIDPREENALNAAAWLRRVPDHLWSRAYSIDSCKSDILQII